MRRLSADSRGNATVEFALLSVFFFAVVVVVLDFAVYVQQKLRLGSAVEQASIMAFNTRDTVNPATLASYIASAAQTEVTPATTITCNQAQTCVNTARTCSCYDATTKLFVVAVCGTTCVSGALSGYYMTISASLVYRATIVPDRWLGGTTLRQSAVVRLQ